MDYHCISKYVYFDVNIHKNSYASHFHRLIFFSRNGQTQKTSTSSGFSEEHTQNESQSVCSDNSSNRSVDDKSDSGNDSDIKKVGKMGPVYSGRSGTLGPSTLVLAR